MQDLPDYISWLFILTTLSTVAFFYFASNRSTLPLIVLFCWLALQTGISLTGFYTNTDDLPPRFLLLPFPPLVVIILLFLTKRGRNFIDSLSPKTLTLLQVVRVPVEIVLYMLAVNKAIPELMTFAGRNFDIFSGLTAPLVWYFGYVKNKLSKGIILTWNFICLGLLFNIVINAIFSVPFPFQKFAFDQPNIGVLYFPFVWLPCCVVPLVLLSHLVCVRRLAKGGK